MSTDFRPGTWNYGPNLKTFCARNGHGETMPWGVCVHGQLLRKKNGVGRSFRTEAAALKAGRAELERTSTTREDP